MAYRTRKSRKNKNIPELDKEGTILEYLITGKYNARTPGAHLAATRFFNDTQEVISETRDYYKKEIEQELKRRANNIQSG